MVKLLTPFVLGVEKPLVDWALWRDNYAAFGLGHGVDASNPYPMKDQRRIVRIVLPDRSNVQEGIKNEKFNYEDIITSVSSQKSSVVSSVSDLVGKVLTFSAEAEYMREYSKELKAKGMSSMKPRVNKGGTPQIPQVKSNMTLT